MNERIKELLVEAEKSVQFLSNSPDSKKQIAMEKFAELIIQECIAVHVDDYGYDLIGYVIKKHFGVKE